MTVYMTH